MDTERALVGVWLKEWGDRPACEAAGRYCIRFARRKRVGPKSGLTPR